MQKYGVTPQDVQDFQFQFAPDSNRNAQKHQKTKAYLKQQSSQLLQEKEPDNSFYLTHAHVEPKQQLLPTQPSYRSALFANLRGISIDQTYDLKTDLNSPINE